MIVIEVEVGEGVVEGVRGFGLSRSQGGFVCGSEGQYCLGGSQTAGGTSSGQATNGTLGVGGNCTDC